MGYYVKSYLVEQSKPALIFLGTLYIMNRQAGINTRSINNVDETISSKGTTAKIRAGE
jgi:hypothetical protein